MVLRIVRRCQQLFHTDIIRIAQHHCHILIDEIRDAGILFVIDLGGDLLDMSFPGLGIDLQGKGIDGLSQKVSVYLAVFGLKHRIDALSTRDILVDIDSLLLIST